MAKEKSPAFQWYPKDFDSDEQVILMTLEEEGAYRRLIDRCWLEGSIPTDVRLLAALCKGIPPKKMEKIWQAISCKFHPHPTERDRVVHLRLEREREKQRDHSEKRRKAAFKRHEHRPQPRQPEPRSSGGPTRAGDIALGIVNGGR